MSPKLLILNGKRRGDVVELTEGDEVDIGNRKSAKLTVRDPWVSYNHARIVYDGGGYLLEDQNSSNGTWVDGERIERHTLSADTVFALGHTKVKFVLGEVTLDDVYAEDDMDGDGVPDGEQRPWWDRVLQEGEGEAGEGGADQATVRRLHRLEDQLHEERRMRHALERFLDLPAGTTAGEAAQAGELEEEIKKLRRRLEQYEASNEGSQVEEIVAVRTERIRRDHMSRLVELEEEAARAQARVVELEGRLQAKTEQVKSEVDRTKEKLQAEIKRLEQDLDLSRKAASEGESEAMKAELARGEELRGEIAKRDLELESIQQQMSESRVDLEAARAEASQWKEEHAKIVQEIDEISMEQIEIEDEFGKRIRDLEDRLRERGLPVPDEGAAPPSAKASQRLAKVAAEGKAKTEVNLPAVTAEMLRAASEEAAADDDGDGDESPADGADDADSALEAAELSLDDDADGALEAEELTLDDDADDADGALEAEELTLDDDADDADGALEAEELTLDDDGEALEAEELSLDDDDDKD